MPYQESFPKELKQVRLHKFVVIPLALSFNFFLSLFLHEREFTLSLILLLFGVLIAVVVLITITDKYVTKIQCAGSVLEIHVISIYGRAKIIEIPLVEITKIKSRPKMTKPSRFKFLTERLYGKIYIHTLSGTRDFKTMGDARDSPELKKLNIELI